MSDDEQTNIDPSSDGLWMSIAELAELKGKARQTVWEKVSRLETDGLLVTRSGPGGTRQVNVADYDRVANETTDFAREQGADTRSNRETDFGGDTRFREAQTKKAQYEAALKSIELKRAVGSLVEIDRVNEVIAEVGEELKRPLDQVALRADDIAAAAASGGAPAVRSLLAQIVFDLRAKITDALRKLDVRSQSGGAA